MADLGSVAWGGKENVMGAHLRKLVNINVRYGSSGYCLVMVNIVFGIICTVVVGLYHYTNIMIPLLLHSNFNISTIQHSIYYCQSVISSLLQIQ